jgi:hypothetical protein
MYTDDQTADSLNVGSCGTRTWAKKSNTNNPRMTAHVTTHTSTETLIAAIIRMPLAHHLPASAQTVQWGCVATLPIY